MNSHYKSQSALSIGTSVQDVRPRLYYAVQCKQKYDGRTDEQPWKEHRTYRIERGAVVEDEADVVDEVFNALVMAEVRLGQAATYGAKVHRNGDRLVVVWHLPTTQNLS